MLTFGSTFSGIDGLGLGLERAGWECRWQIESDPHASAVLARHWSDVARYGDIRSAPLAELERVDAVVGGFPCQPTSVAGKRRGKLDDRWLWPELARLLGVVRPRWVLLENPTGLLAFPEFGEVLGDLASLGFDAEWDAVPAAAVGAPHERDRVFVVAHARCLSGERWGVPGVLDGSSIAGEGEAPERQWVRDAASDSGEAIPDSDCSGRGQELGDIHGGQPDLAGRGAALADANGSRQLQPRGRLQDLTGRSGDRGEDVAHPNGRDGHGRRSAEQVGRSGLEETVARARDAARAQWSTEPDVGRVAYGVPARVDRLTRLGNAVVPQVAEVWGRLILAAHKGAA